MRAIVFMTNPWMLIVACNRADHETPFRQKLIPFAVKLKGFVFHDRNVVNP